MASLKKPLGLQEGNFPHYKSQDSRVLKAVVAATTALVQDQTATLRVTTIPPLPLPLHTRPRWLD